MSIKAETLQDVQDWKKRYNELAKQARESGNKAEPRDLRKIEIFNMISAFHDFCMDYDTEIKSLGPELSYAELEISVGNALSEYWKTIIAAVKQNLPDYPHSSLLDEGYKKLAALQDNLKTRPNFSKMDDLHIVLYFEEGTTAKAKRFPFGSTRLIGIPLSDVHIEEKKKKDWEKENKKDWKQDWMAMPHELGHHVYWNAKFSAAGTNFLSDEIDAVMEKLTQNDSVKQQIRTMLQEWTEEIFADVVGTIIVEKKEGENDFVFAAWKRISKQVVKFGAATTSEKDELFMSDGEHPIPFLLPYIRHFARGKNFRFVNRWKEHYGNIDEHVKAGLLPVDEETPIISNSDLRDTVMPDYVKKISERLGIIKVDKLIEGCSSLEELKKFIGERVKSGTDQADKTELLLALLMPIILDKDEYWVCKNGHTVRGESKKCPTCKARRPWWRPRRNKP